MLQTWSPPRRLHDVWSASRSPLIPIYMNVSTKQEFYTDLLEHLTRRQDWTSNTVIICSSRVDFLDQLVTQIHRRSEIHIEQDPIHQPQAEEDSDHDASRVHPFLLPAIHLLAISQHIRLIYCPTVPSLRAYLSTYVHQQPENATTGQPHLTIVDLLALHHGTSEFTLQGLSRTMSTAVSAAHTNAMNLTLAECKDIRDPTNPDRGSRLWESQVPLLSGSVKIGLEGSRWSGRALTIRKIASRWFQFERPELAEDG